MTAEQADDLFGLALAQNAAIDEDAGQLVADRLMDEERGHRRVDPARQTANDLARADLLADLSDLGGAELGHGPVARKPGDVAHEIADQLGTVRRVDDLRVELHRIDAALVIGDDRVRRARAGRDHAEAGGQRRDLVTMAHPHLMALTPRPQAVEQRAFVLDGDERLAELAAVALFDLATQLLGQRLLAVADAQHRQAAIQDRLRNARAILVDDRGGATRQDDGRGLDPRERLTSGLEGHDLAIDPRLAHAACDELGDLAAEIDDEDAVGVLHGGPIAMSCQKSYRGARVSGGSIATMRTACASTRQRNARNSPGSVFFARSRIVPRTSSPSFSGSAASTASRSAWGYWRCASSSVASLQARVAASSSMSARKTAGVSVPRTGASGSAARGAGGLGWFGS